MTWILFLEQSLNGLQFGVLLFLMAAGLTLVFGIMSFINLAHGALYMFGAYFAALVFAASGSFGLALLAAAGGVFILAALLDAGGLAVLHKRDHLDQVLATFGIVLFSNEFVRWAWGNSPLFMDTPEALSNSVQILGFNYPAYRFAIIGVGGRHKMYQDAIETTYKEHAQLVAVCDLNQGRVEVAQALSAKNGAPVPPLAGELRRAE